MFPGPDELKTESDVEQKLIWPLLTSAYPNGLAYATSDIATKLSIRRLEIGKGTARKIYFPDYMVVLAGLPVLIVEAKALGESLEQALDEARLYGNEINALFPHAINPCTRVVACNGEGIWTAPIDSASPDLQLAQGDFSPSNTTFAKFVELCHRGVFQAHISAIRRTLRKKNYERPVRLIGGTAFQAEELPQNTFGATIAGDYGHIFNPKTRVDRALIVREAYIGSLRQQRYVEPIDRLIRNAVAPTAAKIKPLENTASPREITAVLQERKKLEDQILLLIGSVGAGKSTFIDYLSIVALPKELRDKTVWLRLNLNEAPLAVELAYEWVTKSIVEEFRTSFPDIDFDALVTLEKIFSRELSALKRGALAILEPSSTEFRVRLADRLAQLQFDHLAMAKGIAQLVCSGPNRLLVVVLDNCDKRSRDEQLTMFQVANWIQNEFRCLVILPLRDVTFDLYRHDPPLDTALKQFVFRIEPPQFSDVLQARVRLALKEITRTASHSNTLTFQLPNGIKVTYPAEDQALYLASMLRSLYAHDRFVRQVMTGLAGRDVRKALEIFLDFCMSGHIGEDEIYKIRYLEGEYVLPLSVVARVLLRMQRRFYDGNRSHLKNIVQSDPQDALPDHFVRVTLLHWFEQRLRVKGPAGVEGFHRASDMMADLSALGHDVERVKAELTYLAREGCIVAEHLRTDGIADGDLIKITASGVVHLQLMSNPEYLAACAEDTWIADENLCKRVAERLAKGPKVHFSPVTTARNAQEFVEYLVARSAESICSPEAYLEATRTASLKPLREAEMAIAAAEVTLPERLFIAGIPFESTEKELRDAFEAAGIELKNINYPRNKVSGLSKGFAFIEPLTNAAVLDALNLDNTLILRGRRLHINEAYPLEKPSKREGGERPAPPLSTRVFLGNLPYEFREADVRALLATHDLTPVDVFVPTDGNTGKSKGLGFVELKSMDDAAMAIGALNGVEVQGRRLHVRPADPKRSKKK
jgi:hypothetical protein